MRLSLNDLLPDTDYAVAIRAVGPAGESEWSTKKVFRTTADQTSPVMPTNPSWVSTGDSFHGEWDSVSTNADGDAIVITRYEVELIAGGLTRIDSVPAATGSSKVTYDLSFEMNRSLFTTPRATVTFRVRAVDNKDLKSAWSPVTAISASNPVPLPPTAVTAVAGMDKINLTWTPPADNDIIGYNVYNTASVFLSFVNATSYVYNTTTYSAHTLKVATVDKFGQVSTLANANAVTPTSPFTSDTTPPGVPAISSATLTTASSGESADLAVVWTLASPPSDLAGFQVRYLKSGGTYWSQVSATKEDLSITVPGLTPYVSYGVQVRSYDGSYNYSAWSGTTTATASGNSVPATVASLAGVVANDALTLTWPGVADQDIKNYEIVVSTSSTFASGNLTYLTGTSTALTVSGLSTATPYYARVRAVDQGGLTSAAWTLLTGQPLTTGTFPQTPLSDGVVPQVPAAPTVTGGIGNLNVSWAPVTTNANSQPQLDLVTYEVHVSNVSGFTPSGASLAAETAGTTVTLERGGSNYVLIQGETYYIKLRAKDRDGTNFAASPQGSGLLGRVGAADSTLVPGDIGAPTNAQFNTAIKTYVTEYSVNLSETVAPSTGWSTATPTRSLGSFIWTRVTTTYQDNSTSTSNPALLTGNTGATGSQGIQGPVGSQGIPGPTGPTGQQLFTWIKYADSPTTGMNDLPTGKTYMGIAYNKTTSTESANYADYEWSLIQGPQGNQGIQGPNGANGLPTYTWIKYGTSAAGAGLSDSPTGMTYMGIAYNKTTQTESAVTTDYEWSLIQGPQGIQGIQGTPAALVFLTATSQVLISPPAGGATNPATTTVTGTAVNTTITVWQYSENSGAFSATVPAGVSRTGNVVTITGATMTARTIAIRMADANGVGDTLTVAEVTDGATGGTGAPGADAYTVILTNEAQVFPGSTTAALAGSTTTSVIAYKGAVQQTATIGTITGQVTGLTTAITNNGAVNATVTVTVTTALTATSGTLTIPVTVGGLSFTKSFAWSLGLQGVQGVQGVQGPQGSQGIAGPTGPNGQTLYTWIKYADTPTTGMNDLPAGKTYMGIAYNKASATESSVYTDYEWSLIQGPQGNQGVQGPVGANGQPTYTWIKYGTSAAGAGLTDSPVGMTYMGIAYNKLTATESATPGDYEWSLIQGPQGNTGATGATGSQGIQGPIGPQGQATYTWIKYADTPTTGMNDLPSGKVYMGIAYNKTTQTESAVYADYEWSLIQGADGANGRGISSTAVTYQTGTSGTTAPTGTWVAAPTATTVGQFLWTRTITTYTDATTVTAYAVSAHGATGSTGTTGSAGRGISSTAVTYQIHTNGTTAPVGTWVASPTATTTGQFLWTRTITTYTDATTSTAYSVSAHGATGAQGNQGIQGPIGPDGLPTYTWIKYGTSAAGAGLTDLPAGMTHMGIAYNKTTQTESSVPGDYEWSLIQGPQGTQGPIGSTGSQGIQGPIGPQGQATYTWIKYADTPTTGMNDLPAGKTYMGIAYNKTTQTESAVYADYEWSLIQGPTGATGKGISSTAVTYQTHTNGTTAPTGTWQASPTVTTVGQFLWTRTVITYTDATTATAYSVSAHGATGSTGSTGTPGVGVTGTAVTYQVHTNGTTAPTGTWLSTVPATAAGQFLWTRTITSYSNASTSTAYSVSAHGATGAQGNQGIQGPIGPNGQPTYTWIKYGDNASGGGLSDLPAGKTYIGIAYNKTTQTESAVTTDYEWSLIQGPQGATGPTGPTGPQGSQGIAGTAGANGTTTYTWVKYGTSAAGAGINDSPAGMTYMGLAYNKTTAIESADAGQYEWSLIRGADGATGATGATGTGVSSVTPYYAQVLTGQTPANPTGATPAAPWTTTEPAYTSGTELFSAEKVVYTNSVIAYSTVSKSSSYTAAGLASEVANNPGGGINLFTLSRTFSGLRYGTLAGSITVKNVMAGTYRNRQNASAENASVIQITTPVSGGALRINEIKQNGWHTVSFWAKSNSGTKSMSFDINDAAKTVTIETTWKKFTHSVNVGVDCPAVGSTYNFVDMEFGTTATDVYIYEPMLEVGRSASAYSPSPEESAYKSINYYRNGSFEYDLSDVTAGNASITYPASTLGIGTRALRLTSIDSSQSLYLTYGTVITAANVLDGKTMTLSYWARGSINGMQGFADYRTGTGEIYNPNTYNQSNLNVGANGVDTVWRKYSHTFVVPVNGGTGQVLLIGPYTVGQWIEFDGVQLEEGPIATEFRPNPNDGKEYTDTSANGKNKITHSINAPGSAPNISGDTWIRLDDLTNNRIIGQWRGTGGTTWVSETIRSEFIAYLDAEKINANSTFTNNLNVKSTFTLGSAVTAGTVKSYDYVAGTAGFSLSSAGLEINSGVIKIGAVSQLQTNLNLNKSYALAAGSDNLAFNGTMTEGPTPTGQPVSVTGPPLGIVVTEYAAWLTVVNGRNGLALQGNHGGNAWFQTRGFPVVTGEKIYVQMDVYSTVLVPTGFGFYADIYNKPEPANYNDGLVANSMTSGQAGVTAANTWETKSFVFTATATGYFVFRPHIWKDFLPGTPTTGAIDNIYISRNTAAIEAVQNNVEALASAGTDLVINGTGLLGDNTNFSAFTLDKTDAPVGAVGSWNCGAGYNNLALDQFIPVDVNKKFKLSLMAKQKGSTSAATLYSYVYPHDAYDQPIFPGDYMWTPGTLTTLAVALNPGATTITLTSAANWYGTAANPGNTTVRRMIFWDYTDPGGKLWPPQTYSKNNYGYDEWAAGGIVGNVITLRNPWAGPAKPAGTSLSGGSSGGSYIYGGAVYSTVPATWTNYAATITGIVSDGGGADFARGWPQGTAKAKIGFLINYQVATSDLSRHSLASISFSDASAAADAATAANTAANQAYTRWAPSGATTIDGGIITTDSLDALKIKANSTFTQNLFVKSNFTLGDINTAGVIKSYDYSAGTAGFSLSSAGLEINKGVVRASALSVLVGGENIVSNSSFQNDSNSDGIADGFQLYNAEGGSPSTQIVTDGKFGGKSQRFAWSGLAAANTYVGLNADLNLTSNMDNSKACAISVWVRVFSATAGTYFRLQFGGRVAHGSLTPGGLSADLNTLVGQGWVRLYGIHPPGSYSSGASGAYIGPHTIAAGSVSSGEMYIDGYQIEQGDVHTSYSPRTSEILPGTIIASMVQTDAITSDKILADSISAVKIQARAITTDKLSVSSLGDSVISNGSFEDIYENTRPQGWAVQNGTLTSGGTSGGRWATWEKTATNGGYAMYQHDDAGKVPVSGGDQYLLTFSTSSLGGGHSLRGLVFYYNADGTNLGSDIRPVGGQASGTGVASNAYATTATRSSWVVTLPNDPTIAYARFGMWSDLTATTYYIQRFEVQKVTVSARIADGAIVADKIAAGAITANKLSITMGGENLVPNSSFQTGDGTGSLAGWNGGQTAAGWSQRGGTSAWAGDNIPIWRDITGLKNGYKYTISVWSYKESGNCRLNIHDTTGANSSEVLHGGVNGEVRRLVMPYTANATNMVRVHLYGQGYFDCVQVEEGDVVTAYSPKTDEILPGTISGNMLQANTAMITSLYINSGGSIRSSLWDGSGGTNGFAIFDNALYIRSGSVNANTLVAGTGIVNNLVINSGGVLQSAVFNGTTGFKLDHTGLTINDANSVIKADAIRTGTIGASGGAAVIQVAAGSSLVFNSGHLRSNTYNGGTAYSAAATAGWYLGSDGLVVAQGTVKAEALSGGTFTAGTISIGAGGAVTGPGFTLNSSGLNVTSGTIAGAALNIQAGASNLLQAPWAGFEYQSTWYEGKLSASGATMSISTDYARFGSQSLKNVFTTGSYIYFADPAGHVSTGTIFEAKTYIVSWYAKNTGATNMAFQPMLRVNPGGTFTDYGGAAYVTSVAGSDWTRHSTTIVVGMTGTADLFFYTSGSNTTVYLDGIQIEEKIGSSNTPSTWSAPGGTSIDGAIIRTGSITSNDKVSINGANEWIWSIPKNGAATFSAMRILGNTVLGNGTTDPTSLLASSNFVEGSKGWRIKANGDAEFAGALIRGVTIIGSPGDGINSSIKSVNYDGANNGWWIDAFGNAYFNQARIRGNLSTGTPDGLEIVQSVTPNYHQKDINGNPMQWAITEYRLGVTGWSPGQIWTQHQANDVPLGGGQTGGMKISSPYTGTLGTTNSAMLNLIGVSSTVSHARLSASNVEIAANTMKFTSLNASTFDINVIGTNYLQFRNEGLDTIAFDYNTLGRNIIRSSTSTGALKRLDFSATDIHFVTTGGSGGAYIQVYTNDNARPSVGSSTINTSMAFAAGGIHFKTLNGSAFVPIQASSYTNGSDIKWKKNLEPTTGALVLVNQMKVYDYEQAVEDGGLHRRSSWQKDESKGNPRTRGLVANELVEIAPDFVVINDDGEEDDMGVDIYPLLTTALAAIQELSTMVDNLKAEVATLSKK